MAYTIKDIAKRCSVSEGTVDRALNNRAGISEKTKEKILKVAEEMNYKPNHIARCLATGSTRTIGVICTHITNNFFSALIEEIEANAAFNGYFISLILSYGDINKEIEGVKYMINRKVDGLIIFPAGCGEAYENELKSLNVPIVTIYNRISPDFTHVDVDCCHIMRNAVAHISKKGYNRVIYLDFPRRDTNSEKNTFSIDQRLTGYIEGIAEHNLKKEIYNNCESILDIIKKRAKEDKIAVLCAGDMIAIRMLNLFRCNNIKVPEDVGIMGFDNIDILDVIMPRINSVDCGIRNIGKTAVTVLIEKIKDEYTGRDIVADYSFTEGETL